MKAPADSAGAFVCPPFSPPSTRPAAKGAWCRPRRHCHPDDVDLTELRRLQETRIFPPHCSSSVLAHRYLVELISADVLLTFLNVRLSWVRPQTRALLAVLVSRRGTFDSADSIALQIGLKSRHQLAYLLGVDGLPKLQRLAAWIRLLTWLSDYECQGVTLCRCSLNEAKDPAFRYRLVKRLTGEEWTVVRSRGLTWLLEEFLAKCYRPRKGEIEHTVA